MQSHRFKISFGHLGKKTMRAVTLTSYVSDVVISDIIGNGLERNDNIDHASRLDYGSGDVDELIFEVSWKKPSAELLQINQRAKMWRYLMEHGSSGQVQRLSQDTWNSPDAPLLTVELNSTGTEGFSVPLGLLLKHRAMWLPEQDVFLTTADNPIDFRQHVASLTGERILDSINKAPDATLTEFRDAWKDFGSPSYDVPWQTRHMGTRGHLVITAPAHGSVYKFAVDRWGNVRPDFASPHRFRLDPVWKGSKWKMQKIEHGLPFITTMLEKEGKVCEIHQFAAPLKQLKVTDGETPSIFFTKIKISGESKSVDFHVDFYNEMPDREMILKEVSGNWLVVDKRSDDILLMIETAETISVAMQELELYEEGQKIAISVAGVSESESAEILLKLPSPAIPFSRRQELEATDFSKAKKRVLAYWENWIGRGASFDVPEPEVNKLFRANLWHALILPRHTRDANGKMHMDLPYANTAYGQKNSDWPINQAVYVDYMIYGLRGYEEVAKDEIAAMFQTQQEPDGRIGGFANWGVYTPGHLYAIAQNYLLSGNREHFESLLPNALSALDWCVRQLEKAQSQESTGLIRGPLNDLSHGEREWAFTQAYYAGGLELFAKALSAYGHARADEVKRVSARLKKDVSTAFARSSVKSSIVQLADGTWINFVPTDATTPRRMLDEWYPTDVDTGPLHLTRLGALPARGWLSTAMLHDHEDNLFLQNKGAANEPVYVQQANAYLLRDEPKAVIRSFYSLMACGFSHEQYSPLEHRWAHGQYYGPPSTDGAWFEIYRKMLINEWGNDTLIIGQATPRAWLDTGKRISVRNAPTWFGDISFTIEGRSAADEIIATVECPDRNLPEVLLVRLRHPHERAIDSVLVNGKPWKNINIEKEHIVIPNPIAGKYLIKTTY